VRFFLFGVGAADLAGEEFAEAEVSELAEDAVAVAAGNQA
jgi:hypothetical protein